MKTTRFSGAEWYNQPREILLIGLGGIGSWLALNLSRIGHKLLMYDGDTIDETNVTGGQMFRKNQIGSPKVNAVFQICREMGCDNSIDPINEMYRKGYGSANIVISGLDSMSARKTVFEEWKQHVNSLEENDRSDCILIDGRMTMEMFEILAVRGGDEQALDAYEKDYLFSDEESSVLDCSTKQSTFGAMGIASFMTATLCNFLTNRKYKEEVRTVDFYQRVFFPMNLHTVTNLERPEAKTEAVVELVHPINQEV